MHEDWYHEEEPAIEEAREEQAGAWRHQELLTRMMSSSFYFSGGHDA